MYTNPDCRDGKHRACAGDAWDTETDQRVWCRCTCHDKGRAMDARGEDGLTGAERTRMADQYRQAMRPAREELDSITAWLNRNRQERPMTTRECPECGKRVTVRKDGTLRHHTGTVPLGPGSRFNKPCKETR